MSMLDVIVGRSLALVSPHGAGGGRRNSYVACAKRGWVEKVEAMFTSGT